MTVAAGTGAMVGAFQHDALLYRDAAELVSAAVSFVKTGVDADEPVLVAVPGYHVELIRQGLGGHESAVRFVDMADGGRNPGRIIPFILKAFARENPGRTVRVIGEPVWPGRTADECAACLQHELLMNAAFAGQPITVLCPYDASRLVPEVIAGALRAHPTVVADGIRGASRHYDALRVGSALTAPLPPPGLRPSEVGVGGSSQISIRRFVAGQAASAGLRPDRVDDLMLAVNELVANTIRYGGGAGVLRVWCTPDHLVCEIEDAGSIADPLVGRVPPPPDSPGGRGLLIVNYLCDLVRMSTNGGSTTVRIFMRLREPATTAP